jgi:hypothetical protein
MSKKFSTISCLIAVFALALMAFAPAAFAHHDEDHTQGGGNGSTATSEEHGTQSAKGAENTPGNDRKEGYEDNSTTPQETNRGAGSDHDGDADSDPNTAYEDDHTTADAGDNRHPSGKDRSVENGGSGNQGKSESNPDDSKGPMRYEGTQGDDKPGGPGGTDLADQDGNNGCGNDDDFDDDNNGWCGRPTKVKPTDVNKPVCDADATMPGTQKCETTKLCPNGSAMPASGKCDEVLGEVITKTCPNGSAMPASGNCGVGLEEKPVQPDEVLGEIIERDENPAKPEGPQVLGVRLSPALAQPVAVAGAVLPFTGGDLLIFLATALGLIAAGAVALKVRSNES